ncbi:MAG TPA: type I secretion system permease/ATPase [Rhodanobacteraceae bacterium]
MATVEMPPMPGTIDGGLTCLVVLARFHGIAADPAQLAHTFQENGKPFSEQEILLAARSLKLKAKAVDSSMARLPKLPLPAIALDAHGGFCILARADEQSVLIHDPLESKPRVLSHAEWGQRWPGRLILFSSQASVAGDLARFDFSWFVPAIVKYRRLLGEILIVSFFLQLIGLATPLFFQVVMDKVLVHRGLDTLDVIALGILFCSIFETLLSGLRTYVFSHTTSRIDVELGARLFRHLLTLPLAYFQARRVGDSVARVRELETIRSFLTGNAVTLVMDVLFSFVFLGVMLLYSGWLTLVVVASLPIYVLLSVVLTPLLRSRLREKFDRGAENQAFLVEAVSGIQTLKAMAVEPQITRQWDNQMAGYVASGFRTTTMGTLAREGVGLVGKLVTVVTIWLGARLVISGELTLGQLVAFNMLASRVAQPIMRIAQLWTDFQQTGVSMQRLGDILNAPTEAPVTHRSPVPSLEGRVELDNVSFRYRPDMPEVLQAISLNIQPGEVIGVVGRSGSGKSTLTKLVQRLYVPERGRVLIDGLDLAMVDVSSLRRQIGVVLQENVLFNRSVRENIALADPGAPLEEVVRAAQLAGAHDFILELPEGYDTIVGEQGATLSGGQRQRIAIARALMTNPRILIFDEATSALDYESERIIQANMRAICEGRTVIIIAHRLSAVRDASRVVVMDHGRIVEQGSHGELLAQQAGHYARLHRLQQA